MMVADQLVVNQEVMAVDHRYHYVYIVVAEYYCYNHDYGSPVGCGELPLFTSM